MGIGKSCFRLLVEAKKKGTLKGEKVLQLGRQHTFVTYADAVEAMKGLDIPDVKPMEGFLDDITLFSLLGFKTIHSIDALDYENATFIHDLNLPVPKELENSYDFIIDGGTLEHVFSTHQVFKNIHALLKVGGRILHVSPSHNHVDHGFYMFSPRLFAGYYEANQYEPLESYLIEYSFPVSRPWKMFKYELGHLDGLSFGGFGKELLGVWYLAKKLPQSTDNVIPSQLDSYIEGAKKKRRPNKIQRALNKLIKKKSPRGAKSKLEFIGKF